MRIASYSQLSQRYAKVVTQGKAWFVCPKSITDYSIANRDTEQPFLQDRYNTLMSQIASFYQEMLDKGIPAEDARMVLPNACHTSIIMSLNARSFIEICKLRTCNKAQWEIRQLFKHMRELIKDVYPNVFDLCFPKCKNDKCPESKPCGTGYE